MATEHPLQEPRAKPRLANAGEPAVWRTDSTRRAFANRWVGVDVDAVTLLDGTRYEYTRIEPAGIGVGVIGFNHAGEVLLEREYRHGVGEVIWQLPGGLADVGESLKAAGLRELREETGYGPESVSAENVRYLGAVWDNPALGTGQSHIFAAWNVIRVAEPQSDLGEFVAVHWCSPRWVCQAIRSGEIKDRVVVAAVAHLLVGGWFDVDSVFIDE